MPSEHIRPGKEEFKVLSKQLRHFINNLLKEQQLPSLRELQAVNSDRYRQINFLLDTINEIEKAIKDSKTNENGVYLHQPPSIYPASILRTAIDLVCKEIYASYWIRDASNSRLYKGLEEILRPTEEKTQIDLANMKKQMYLKLEDLKAKLLKPPSYEAAESGTYLVSFWGLFARKDAPCVSIDSKTSEVAREAAAPAGLPAP